MRPFSSQTRAAVLSRLPGEPYELIIIGGGITGAGVVRDAVLRGMRTLLLEKNDFASGTSSKSSKLVHGGLRYLKMYEFGLTRESCQERNLLTNLNPHLIKPIPFMLPIYEGDKEGPFLVRCGMWLYEILSGFRNYKRHRMLNPKRTLEQIPSLRDSGLRGSALYYDAAVDDVRLTLETLKSAVEQGADVLNYTSVTEMIKENGKVVGVRFVDSLTGQSHDAYGTVVINATGVWVDEIRAMDGKKERELRPSKGIHVVVPADRIQQSATLAFPSVQDRRLMFAIPWGNVTLIGTTDTFFDGSVDTVQSDDIDVKYVLDATNHIFPNANLTEDDIIACFAGLRPLIAPRGDEGNASAVSREHQIFEDDSGLLSIAGGKLTTYRRMARSLVDLSVKRLPAERRKTVGRCITDTPLAGKVIDVEKEVQRLTQQGHPPPVARHLVETYGPDVDQVLSLCKELPGGLSPFAQGEGFLRGEVLQAVRFESALHLTDLLTRRLRFALWVPGQGLDIAEDASRIMGAELGWSEATRQEELKRFELEITRYYRPVAGKV
jgi:glycerol-3-phosphate dehydrogenase